MRSLRRYGLTAALLLCGLFAVSGYSRDRFAPRIVDVTTIITHTLHLEDELIWIHEYIQPGNPFTFVSLHDDENTCVEASLNYISRFGGRMLEFRHGRGREVVIRRNGVKDKFDPNRMFSPEGLRKSLRHYGNNSAANRELGSKFAREVVDLIGIEKNGTVIAVHNNTEGKLTIHEFNPGGMYAEDTGAVHVSETRDTDDFFYTNSPALFRRLVEMNYNVALRNDNILGRGTLGEFVHLAGGIYVNVEAQHGHYGEQLQMLEDLGKLLEDLSTSTP